MEGENMKKRKGANFAKEEIDLLCNLVVKYKATIENKKTDAVTWAEKQKCWDKICSEFNTETVHSCRPATSLRTKYEGFKKDLQKKVAAQKQALYGTGGGPWTEPDLSTNEYKIYGLISISVDGLESRFDDDDLPCGVNNIQRNINNDDDDEDDDDTIANMQIVENIEIVVDNSLTADDGAKHQVRAGTSRESTTEDQKRSWTKWKPSDLKRNVSTPLSVKRRRIVSRPEATEKVTILAESKKVVMDLQAESLKLDVEFKKKNMHLNYANLRRN